MSEEIVNTFIRERLSNAYTKDIDKVFREIARTWTDQKRFHRIAITEESIENIINKGIYSVQAIFATQIITSRMISKGKLVTENTERLIRKAQRKKKEKSLFNNNALLAESKKIAGLVLSRLKDNLKSEVVNSDISIKNSGLEIVTKKNDSKKIKDIIFREIYSFINQNEYPELYKLFVYKDKKGAERKSKLFNYMTYKTQFLHKNLNDKELTVETVGTSQAEILIGRTIYGEDISKFDTKKFNFFKEDSLLPNWYNSDSRESARQLLEEAIISVFSELGVTWKLNDKDIENRKIEITGVIANYLENPPGAEAFDWSKLKPKILLKLQSRLNDLWKEDEKSFARQFAEGKGSQPFNQRLGSSIINKALSKVTANKKVKVKKLAEDGLKKYKRNFKIKSKKRSVKSKPYTAKSKKVILHNIPIKSENAKETKASKPILNLNALKAQINARLSMTIIKNMGTPALENRTGRFARSVQVTDVIQTSKGFPSIGYDYQKYPYQTFEPGFKQGSVQRDPRTLIDRSIREIASELIVGRFYTRRV